MKFEPKPYPGSQSEPARSNLVLLDSWRKVEDEETAPDAEVRQLTVVPERKTKRLGGYRGAVAKAALVSAGVLAARNPINHAATTTANTITATPGAVVNAAESFGKELVHAATFDETQPHPTTTTTTLPMPPIPSQEHQIGQ